MARAKKKADVFQWDRNSLRVQSLGGGANVRIFDHEGHAWLVEGRAIDAGMRLAELIAEIRDVDVDCADRIVDQLPDVWAERYAEAIVQYAEDVEDVEDVEVVS
jgi:hypothetical protein